MADNLDGDLPATIRLWGNQYDGPSSDPAFQRFVCALSALPMCAAQQCAPGCWAEVRNNTVCDAACNSPLCDFDSGDCRYQHRRLDGYDVDCSPGCRAWMLTDTHCDAECNNANCDYDNWVCRCSANCPTVLQSNDKCDVACNNTFCRNDNGHCLQSTVSTPPSTATTPTTSSSGSSSSNATWLVGVFVGCSAFCCLYFPRRLSVIFLLFVIMKRMRRLRMNPANETMREERIVSFNKQQFSPTIVEFGQYSCAICLTE